MKLSRRALSPLLCLFALLCLTAVAARAASSQPQYIFLNRAPGLDYDQNKPESITDEVFTAPLNKVGARGTAQRRLGLSFEISYLNGPPAKIERSLRRLLALSRKYDTPVRIALDGQNWWDYRPDLWNWWDRQKPGYDPANAFNVEWDGPGTKHALKIAWRNWGSQIRVLPPPNLASPRFRRASRTELLRLVGVLRDWARALPASEKYLFPGVEIGWEASLGVNAYYYPSGNALRELFPDDTSHDPRGGLDMNRDFAGGLMPLGYAALQSKGWTHAGAVTKRDQERITQDYLAFLARLCRQAGLPRDQIWTHAGGQFAPWEKHFSHSIALNDDSRPGWSFYGHLPDEAGDLPAVLKAARVPVWAAAEWYPNATTAAQWENAFNRTLGFANCRYLALYNWELIRDNPAAIEGLRRALVSQ